ncbi:MAG TPA: FliH/SctL family protein [Xanthobacteraceae bacterium]|nr:FliH/SctL family protein [Xanthobacteraceae bacterium]
MRAGAKYLFDLDFGGGESKPGVTLAEHQAKLAEAEATGYRNGIAVAEAQALTDSGRLTALALERLASAFAGLDQALHAVEAKLEAEAVQVAVAVGRKLAPALIAQEPLAEIAALARDCFRQIVAAPHVVVRVNDSLYAATRERLEEILRSSGFEGRLVVLAEPDIAAGDCRIEWADGGITRDRAAAEVAIVEAVNRYIAARTAAAIPHDHPGRSAS